MNVGVVIPTAGPVGVLAKTLSAVRRELPNVTLVVVDDRAGRREVASTVRDYAGELVTTDSIGSGGARNFGAAQTRTEWLLFLDDDVTIGSGVGRVVPELMGSLALSVVGALHAPVGAPGWLADTYTDGTMAPTASRGASATDDGSYLTCALALVRRDAWADAGGFPQVRHWGWEDTLFGLRLQRIATRSGWLVHDPRLCGVHEFVPTWEQWLARQRTAGERLPEVLADLPQEERDQLLLALGFANTTRADAKRALGRLPAFVWRRARGRLWRRSATVAAFAAGYRAAAHGR